MSQITVSEPALWRRAGFPFKLLDVRCAQARAADGRDIEGATGLDARHLYGGMSAWKAAQQPVVALRQSSVT